MLQFMGTWLSGQTTTTVNNSSLRTLTNNSRKLWSLRWVLYLSLGKSHCPLPHVGNTSTFRGNKRGLTHQCHFPVSSLHNELATNSLKHRSQFAKSCLQTSKMSITCKLFKPQILGLQPKMNQKLCLEKQQGPATQHRELYPISRDNLQWKQIQKRICIF